MKHSPAILLALAGLLFLPACATPRQPITPAQWGVVAQTAAYTGAAIALDRKPEIKPAFVTAKAALDLALANGEFDAAALHRALQTLGPRVFEGTTGIVVVDAAVVLVTTLQGGQAPLNQAPIAKAVMEGIAHGIGQALETR